MNETEEKTMTLPDDEARKLADRIKQRTSSLQDKNGCLKWIGSINSRGYGNIRYKGKTFQVHRIVYKIYKGRFPEHLYIGHRCNNKSCVNPDHLYPCTHKQNILDAIRDGLMDHAGIKNGRAVLSEKQVIYARSKESRHVSSCALARKFKVGHTAISDIRLGKTWAHLPQPPEQQT